jgi:hypothetical protein
MMLRRIGMELSNGVESQNIEFKSIWLKARLELDKAGWNYKLQSRLGYW